MACLRARVLCVVTCLRAHVLCVLPCLCAYMLGVLACLRDHVLSVLLCLACLRAWRVYVFSMPACLLSWYACVLGVFTWLACLRAYLLGVLAYVCAWLLRWNVLFSYMCTRLVFGVLFCLICFTFQYLNLKILWANKLCTLLSWTYFLFIFWYQLIKLYETNLRVAEKSIDISYSYSCSKAISIFYNLYIHLLH